MLIMLLGYATQAAETGAHDWLARINRAAQELNYAGVFVYLHENKIEAMRIVHQTDRGTMKERLYSLNGEAREVIRDNRQIWCYLPKQKMGVHEYRRVSEKTFPGIIPDQVSVLDSNYDIKLAKTDRIADRTAQRIVIQPKDGYRYGYQLWADAETGLLLKADLTDTDGAAVEQYMFTEVTVGDKINPAALAPRTPTADLVWHGEEPQHEAPVVNLASTWAVGRMPPGYSLTTSMRRVLPVRKMPIDHLVFSDGLAAVSVFIERRRNADAEPMTGLSRMGAVHAFGTIVDEHQIMVVGEVPAATVDMMGRSVTRSEASALEH